MRSQSKSNTSSLIPNYIPTNNPKNVLGSVNQLPNTSGIKSGEKRNSPDSLFPNLFSQQPKIPETPLYSTDSSFSLDFSLLTFEEKILRCELGEMKISELFDAFSDLQKNLHIYFKNIKK